MNDKLIDDYIDEVTRDMGARQRSDVARELRTHILDSADALAAERGTPVDAAIVREVIAKMGPARKVASLYPSPKAVLEMKGLREAILGLGGLAFAFLLVAGVLWLIAPDALQAMPFQLLLTIAGALVLAIFVITVIFAAMYVYDLTLKTPYEARLKRIEKSMNTKGSSLNVFFTIFGTIVGLAVCNLLWAQIPMINGFGGDAHLVPLFSSDFGATFLPWVNLMGVLTIAVQLLYLVIGRSKWIPALLEMCITVANTLVIAWALKVFPFNAAQLSPGVQSGVKVILAVLIVLTLIAAAVQLWQTVQLYMRGSYERGHAT